MEIILSNVKEIIDPYSIDKIDNDNDLNKDEMKKETIATFSQKAIVKEVIYSTIPIDYPKTSEFDIAIVFNINDQSKDCWKNIQYSLGSGGQNSIKTTHSLITLV
ncbi:hypothetical protein C1645_839580 [Glomus cerebriforme]|uniref:Uncharacterized protein n=1 Tax=Glomus cerebriforme TaxID=658196 RepID=A0A397S0E7_9GLOM|nr:hypothetical protein C1645_839580 [Glomus cerebriforme]